METSAAAPAGRPARVRNRRGEGARLRADIVSAAAALLDEFGDERAVTLRSVARRVGIAAPSIYPHFRDQPAIMLAVVQQAFAELEQRLRAAAQEHPGDARPQLYAVCTAYLDFARSRPQRYRAMFGGLWIPELHDDSSVTKDDVAALGQDAMQVLIDALAACVAAGHAASTDVAADAVTLWLGLHGLAHQRAVTRALTLPHDVADRIITALAHLHNS